MADDLRALLYASRAKHGVLSTESLVEDARPKNHPLHHRFEWDNRVAGHQYRLFQAGELIRSVKIQYSDDPPKAVREWVNTRRDGEYEPVEEVVVDEFSRTLLLRQMNREWLAFRRRWEHMSEFAELVQGQSGAA